MRTATLPATVKTLSFMIAAEGVLVSLILLIAEFAPKKSAAHCFGVQAGAGLAGSEQRQRQESVSTLNGQTSCQSIRQRWFSGAALNTGDQAMASVMSTVMSRLNAFLDSEMEQVLCFDTAIDAERFCNEIRRIHCYAGGKSQRLFFYDQPAHPAAIP